MSLFTENYKEFAVSANGTVSVLRTQPRACMYFVSSVEQVTGLMQMSHIFGLGTAALSIAPVLMSRRASVVFGFARATRCTLSCKLERKSLNYSGQMKYVPEPNAVVYPRMCCLRSTISFS